MKPKWNGYGVLCNLVSQPRRLEMNLHCCRNLNSVVQNYILPKGILCDTVMGSPCGLRHAHLQLLKHILGLNPNGWLYIHPFLYLCCPVCIDGGLAMVRAPILWSCQTFKRMSPKESLHESHTTELAWVWIVRLVRITRFLDFVHCPVL
jgi:hypothetical protein